MTERFRILILEDDARRTAAMRERLEDRFGQYETLIVPDAQSFMAAFLEAPERVIAISLDHDLNPVDDQVMDPGTGRDAAEFLVRQSVDASRLPILIHSTNLIAVEGMGRVLSEAGYHVHRVTPYGDLDWISDAWFPQIRQCILAANESALLAMSQAESGLA